MSDLEIGSWSPGDDPGPAPDTQAPEPETALPLVPGREAEVPVSEPEAEPEAQPEPEPTPQDLAQQAADEAEARKYGWKPEAEWEGAPPKRGFMGVEEFLQSGPYMRQKTREYEERLGEVNKTLEQQREAQETQQTQAWRSQLAALDADYDHYEEIAAQRGDLQLLRDLRAERRDLLQQHMARRPVGTQPQPATQEQQAPQQPQVSPEVEAYARNWRVRNADAVATPAGQLVVREIYAQVAAERAANPAAFADERDVLAAVEARGRQLRPDLFRAPAPAQPQPGVAQVEGGTPRGAGAPAQKGFVHLPREARDAFAQFARTGVFQDTAEGRAAYARDYWES